MSTMAAVQKKHRNRGITVTNTIIPEPQPDEVLIKVKTVGICGTDLHIFKWDEWSQKRLNPPVIIGHEFTGEICEVGDRVKCFKKGQRVTAESHLTCGYCPYCKKGLGHICHEVRIIGVDCDGCFAEYVCVPENNVWHVHNDIPDKYAALYDPLGNAMHTVMAAPISMKNVLLTGAGSIGLFALSIAKANGASGVIVVEPNPLKQEIACKLGADIVLDPADCNLKKKILDCTDGFGPDVLLEMSGDSNALHMGLDLLSNGGTVSLLASLQLKYLLIWQKK